MIQFIILDRRPILANKHLINPHSKQSNAFCRSIFRMAASDLFESMENKLSCVIATPSKIFLPFKKARWFLVKKQAKVDLILSAIIFVIILNVILQKGNRPKVLKGLGL